MSTNPSVAPRSTSAAGSKTKGVVSLVLGIISIVTGFLIPIVGVITGVIAVIFGFLSRKGEPAARSLALAGIITGFAGIALSIVMWVVSAMALAAALQQ